MAITATTTYILPFDLIMSAISTLSAKTVFDINKQQIIVAIECFILDIFFLDF